MGRSSVLQERAVEFWNRLHERPGIRLGRAPEYCARWTLFDHPPVLQHDYPFTDLVDDGEIVGDKDHREIELLLQILQQFQGDGLDRHVQGTYRFVGHKKFGARS